MNHETIQKLLNGTDEDVQIAMYWLFKNLDTNRRSTTYIKEYNFDRRHRRNIMIYNSKFMLNTGWFHLVFSKSSSGHYKQLVLQIHDIQIKEDDI